MAAHSKIRSFGLLALALGACAFSPHSNAEPASRIDNPILRPTTPLANEPIGSLPTHPEWHAIRENGAYVLYAKDNDVLASILKDLKAWKLRHGENTKFLPAVMKDSGYFKANIDSLIPSFAASLLQKHNYFDGPNSWGAALQENGIISTPRYVDEREFKFYLKSPLCRLVTSSESPQLGDLGVVRAHFKDGTSQEVHAFVVIDRDMVFAKDDPGHVSPWTLQTPALMMQSFGLNRVPERCRDDRANNNQDCETTLEYVRCDSVASLTSEPEWKVEPRIATLLGQIKILEERVSSITLGQAPYSEDQGNAILDEHSKLFDIEAALENTLIEELGPDEVAWHHIGRARFSLVSMAYQISAFFSDMRLQADEKWWYRHEAWQGVALSPVMNATRGPVQRWLTCRPGAACEKDPSIQTPPAPIGGGMMRH